MLSRLCLRQGTAGEEMSSYYPDPGLAKNRGPGSARRKPCTTKAAMSPIANTGRSSPLGAHVVDGGVNFSVYSRDASGMALLLFDREDDEKPARIVQIDPAANRTYHYWHVFVPGVQPEQIYGYRAQGPFNPTNGMRFDPAKVLLDPYGSGNETCAFRVLSAVDRVMLTFSD